MYHLCLCCDDGESLVVAGLCESLYGDLLFLLGYSIWGTVIRKYEVINGGCPNFGSSQESSDVEDRAIEPVSDWDACVFSTESISKHCREH